MAIRREVAALVHHIELHESEWWSEATDRIVLAALWLSDTPSTVAHVQTSLRSMGIDLSEQVIQESLARLEAADRAIVRDGNATLSHGARSEVEHQVKSAEESERGAKEVFARIQTQYTDPPLPIEWEFFNDSVLLPIIDELGAETYALVTGRHSANNPSDLIRPFLDDIEGREQREATLEAIVDFLDPGRREVRDYVLRYLTAAFVSRAPALDDETVKFLRSSVGSQPQFEVFVDTNFLFSLLNLHDNPANEVADEILRLARESPQRVGIVLRVLPITLDEAKHALTKAQGRCQGLVLRANIGTDLRGVRLGGLEKRFVEQAQSGGTRNSHAYFTDIMANLRTLTEDAGLTFHNVDTGSLAVDETVATDILNLLEHERRTAVRPKGYEQVAHDVILWHYARSRRPHYSESPIEAGYWISTADYRFIGYDAHRSERDNSLPICIDPASLLQILRFWVPMDEALERALAGSVRVLFSFQTFDKDAERVTLRVLEAMSRLEDAPYLRPETALRVVINRELRRRISDVDDPDDVVELVKSELASRERELTDAVSERDAKLEVTSSALDSATEERDKYAERAKLAEARLEELEVEKGAHIEHLERQVRTDREQIEGLRGRQEWAEVLMASFFLTAAAVGLGLGLHHWTSPDNIGSGVIWALLAVGLVEAVLGLLGRHVSQRPRAVNWAVSQRGRLMAGVVAVGLAVLGSWVWQWIEASSGP